MKKLSIFVLALFFVLEVSSTLMAQVTVVAGNGSTSANGRAPQGGRKYINTRYIVTASDMSSSGFNGLVTSVGWRWNVASPPAATGPIAQSISTTGKIRVYLRDTTGAAITISGTFVDTSGAGYTKIIDGTINIPAGLSEINIDVPTGGPGTSPFTYTPGNAVVLIFVYETTSALATPIASPNCFCTNAGGNLVTFQSQTTGIGNGTSSTFRPETRFGKPILPNDVGISSASVGAAGMIISAGKGYNVNATVKNYGSNSQSNINAFYTVNAGSPAGPVVAAGPLALNATENIVFSGGNDFIPLSAGIYVLKVYTSLVGDGDLNNDTATLNISVFDKISTFPYVQNFTSPTGWTVTGAGLFSLGACTNPDGVAADLAAFADFYSVPANNTGVLRSPEMDFTGMSNPVLNFYVAYRTFATEADRMQVLVSVDGGVTFNPASTPYNKTVSTSPSLATLPANTVEYIPSDQSQWRQETVDLSNVGNLSNVVIGFIGTSAFGNNAYIDNVIISQPNSLCTDAVTGPGTYSCNSKVSLNFTATPLPPPLVNQSATFSSGKEMSLDVSLQSNITSSGTGFVINSSDESDNPNGGTAFVSQNTNNNPGQTIAPNVGNGDATPPVGPAYDPTNVYHDYWFTVTYDGNDQTGYATYNISIDIAGSGFTMPDELYIVKRTDRTGSWVCQNTTISGTVLTVTGLTDFCDFALAGMEALPVELSSFVSIINGRNVELNWSTASETNNSGFDIERSSATGGVKGQTSDIWTKVGSVSGNGTSTISNSYSYTDRNLASGNYSYRLKQIDFNGNFEYFNLNNEVIIGVPVNYSLSQNYPNPFNPTTKINFDLPVDGNVSIKIFDMSGKEVMTLVNEVKTAGYYSVNFSATGGGSNLSSGIYFYTLSAGDFVSTKKMTLIK